MGGGGNAAAKNTMYHNLPSILLRADSTNTPSGASTPTPTPPPPAPAPPSGTTMSSLSPRLLSSSSTTQQPSSYGGYSHHQGGVGGGVGGERGEGGRDMDIDRLREGGEGEEEGKGEEEGEVVCIDMMMTVSCSQYKVAAQALLCYLP